MSKSPSHTSSERAVQLFHEHSRIGRELGFGSQLIEDSEFRGEWIRLRGKDLANFGLCSYLGLSDDPRLVEAAVRAVRQYGSSYSSSIAYTAVPLYGDLRTGLSKMLGASVVLAPSTTLAHMAALPVLVREGDTVVVDSAAHASLLAVVPSLQANGARIKRIPTSKLDRLGRFAEMAPGRTWYLFDGLYSMTGATAPAEELRAMLDRHPDLWLYCDDAHSLSWSGEHGRGQFLERAGWHERIVMAFGLSKSFGTLGGVVATPDDELSELIEWTGGPLVFGGPIPPHALGAGVASAEIHLSEELPRLQEDLMERIRFINDYAGRIGLPFAANEDTPLFYVEIGTAVSALSAASVMLDRGFYVNAAVFPVVPRNQAGLRFTVTRYNSFEQIQALLDALNDVRIEHQGPDTVVDLTVLEDQAADARTQR